MRGERGRVIHLCMCIVHVHVHAVHINRHHMYILVLTNYNCKLSYSIHMNTTCTCMHCANDLQCTSVCTCTCAACKERFHSIIIEPTGLASWGQCCIETQDSRFNSLGSIIN